MPSFAEWFSSVVSGSPSPATLCAAVKHFGKAQPSPESPQNLPSAAGAEDGAAAAATLADVGLQATAAASHADLCAAAAIAALYTHGLAMDLDEEDEEEEESKGRPLHLAIKRKLPLCASALLQLGASMEGKGKALVSLADTHTGLALLLVDPRIASDAGETGFMLACREGADMDALEALLQRTAAAAGGGAGSALSQGCSPAVGAANRAEQQLLSQLRVLRWENYEGCTAAQIAHLTGHTLLSKQLRDLEAKLEQQLQHVGWERAAVAGPAELLQQGWERAAAVERKEEGTDSSSGDGDDDGSAAGGMTGATLAGFLPFSFSSASAADGKADVSAAAAAGAGAGVGGGVAESKEGEGREGSNPPAAATASAGGGSLSEARAREEFSEAVEKARRQGKAVPGDSRWGTQQQQQQQGEAGSPPASTSRSEAHSADGKAAMVQHKEGQENTVAPAEAATAPTATATGAATGAESAAAAPSLPGPEGAAGAKQALPEAAAESPRKKEEGQGTGSKPTAAASASAAAVAAGGAAAPAVATAAGGAAAGGAAASPQPPSKGKSLKQD